LGWLSIVFSDSLGISLSTQAIRVIAPINIDKNKNTTTMPTNNKLAASARAFATSGCIQNKLNFKQIIDDKYHAAYENTTNRQEEKCIKNKKIFGYCEYLPNYTQPLTSQLHND
jgi:hypothetical protein